MVSWAPNLQPKRAATAGRAEAMMSPRCSAVSRLRATQANSRGFPFPKRLRSRTGSKCHDGPASSSIHSGWRSGVTSRSRAYRIGRRPLSLGALLDLALIFGGIVVAQRLLDQSIAPDLPLFVSADTNSLTRATGSGVGAFERPLVDEGAIPFE